MIKLRPRLIIFLVSVFAFFVYVKLSVSRFIIDTDFMVVVDEISNAEMSPYTYREFLYWLPLKILVQITSSTSLSIFLYEFVAFSFFFASISGSLNKNYKAILFACLVVSPIAYLGIINIHRQYMATLFAVAFFIGVKPTNFFGYLIRVFISIAIHNSMLLFAPLFYYWNRKHLVQKLVGECQNKIISYEKFAFALAAIFISFVLFEYGEWFLNFYYRDGSEINTSLAMYTAYYFSSIFLLHLIKPRRYSFLSFAFYVYIIGCILFEFSGASSGSRLFLSGLFLLTAYSAVEDGSLSRIHLTVASFLFLLNFLVIFTNDFIMSALKV